jgi:membrane-bound serine protease (ClpP class)
MVDPAVEIPGLVEAGQLLTLTTTEAQQWGYADGVAATRDELLSATGLASAPVIETEPSFAENVARFVTDPVIASLLITIGLLLIVGDFLVEGVGIPALVGVGLIALFFWGHLLAGLAGWEDLLLIVLGLALIAVELFVIPGFGVAGVLGIVALLGGVFLAMLGREIRTPEGIERAALTVVASLGLFVLGLIAIVALLPKSSRFGGLVLQANVDGAATTPATSGRKPGGWLRLFGGSAPLASERPSAVDAGVSPVIAARASARRPGVALSDLRPSGVADFDGRRIDVVTEGEFIPAGEAIAIVRDDGYRRVVRRVAVEQGGGQPSRKGA